MNAKMKSLLLFLIGAYACTADYSPLSYTDRPCGKSIDNLWVDIVAVVDNSHGMTDKGLGDIAATLSSVVSKGTRIGTNYTDPRSTRLALVTYNSVAKIDADLNKFQNLDDVYNNVFPDLSSVATTDVSYLANGLSMAEQLFQDGQVGYNRANYKQVVIVFASAYSGKGNMDPLPVADRLKTFGIKVITVAYNQRGDGALLTQLAKIASPRYNFTSDDGSNLVPEIQDALMEINCFCPNDWTQYRTSFADTGSLPFGVCVQPVTIAAYWRAAQMNCRNRQNTKAYMVTEFTQQKHDFVLDVMRNITSMPYKYHIGLNMVSGKWVWDQPLTWPQPLLQNYTNWSGGYPVGSSSMSAVQNVQSGYQTFWKNVGYYTDSASYLCESYSCDTDNYCVPDDQ